MKRVFCRIISNSSRWRKIKIGGLELNKLKTKRQRFTFPFLSMVEASAIGLGETAVLQNHFTLALVTILMDGLWVHFY